MVTVPDIAYNPPVGRWEPNAQGRLKQAALDLYVEQGFDATTVAEIAAALGDMARWLRQDPLRLTDALSMDVATTMLVLDTRLDAHARPDLAEDVQIGSLLDRLKAHQRGERLSPLAIVESDAQSRQVNRQLVHEIQTSLAEVEQSLDSFFRAPGQTDILAAVRAPLKQVEGALSVMNEDAAMRLVQDAAARIAALSAPDADTGTEAFEEIAHRLSALGVYIEALQHGPADLARILRPDDVPDVADPKPMMRPPRFVDVLIHASAENSTGAGSFVEWIRAKQWDGRDRLPAFFATIEAEDTALRDGAKTFAQECRDGSAQLLDHITTIDVVRDLIPRLRVAGAEGIIEYALNKVI